MDIDNAKNIVREHGRLQFDGFDDCIIGIAEAHSQQLLLVYDRDKVRQHLVDDGFCHDDAEEYIDFNIVGAWMGEGTSLVLTRVDK